MSLFYPFVTAQTPFGGNDFNSLINLFDEPTPRRHCRRVPTFTPRFDIKESKTGYELHGELPGIEQKDVNIEWTEGNNLTIRGHTEYSREERSPPATEETSTPATEETKASAEEEDWTSVSDGEKHDTTHQATVEDEPEAGGSSTAVKAPEPEKKEAVKPAQKPTSKYWMSERSVGQFQRTFQFQGPIDKEAVKATFKNGVLSIIIPKREPQIHRIQIE